MKLDFSALTQPAAKARGQVGTTGTPAFTRVSASPPAQPGAGTSGDKPAAVVLVPDLLVAVPAVCPPVSPACPQVADPEKLNAGAVSPVSPLVPTETAQVAAAASMLTDELRAALRASKPDMLALLAAEQEAFEERAGIMEFDGGLPRAEAEAAARQCVDCEHYGRRRTCLEPVAAGLLTAEEGFGIVWPPEGHGAGCPAFSDKATTKAQERPYRLARSL